MQSNSQLNTKLSHQAFVIGLVALGAMALNDSVYAQGATSQLLRNIQTQSVGVGFSVDSINRQTLNQDRARIPATLGTSINQGGGARSKPFTNAQSRPTVSPYLNLFNEGFSDGADNYNTLVRPQINQQRTNAQFRRQNEQLRRQEQAVNSRFQALSARPAFTPTGNQNILTTGHRTFYNNTSHYYPR